MNEKLIKLGTVIKNARENEGYTHRELAKIADIKSPGEISQIENGNRKNPSAVTIKKIAKALKLDYFKLFSIIDYIDSNDIKPADESAHPQVAGNVRRIKTKKVPMYGTASAGPGYLNLSLELDEFVIPEEDYKAGRFAVKVEGDSMTGPGKSIPSGSIALVDPAMCNDIEGLIKKVCVFTYNDETYIKQLIIDNQNIIHLVSFNPDIPDIIVLNPKELKCNGKVVKTYFEQKW
ncbi:LexA family transcriptional regulator [uncultured Ilyobacter sp.]|uniref:XRE family transcriptional regulator n=1 Tax=uncultured Ilyobacter sp. TaxID=544433 RepID=UPI002AA627BF|nr:LexA family transcriptional regulator [uncultured Ilyobacter sp.]